MSAFWFGGFGGVLAVTHAFQLDAVGIEEEHSVVVIVILAGRVDDPGLQVVAQENIQVVDVFAAA